MMNYIGTTHLSVKSKNVFNLKITEQESACVEEGRSGSVWQLKNDRALCLYRRGLKWDCVAAQKWQSTLPV
jgi:hypothetical protein